MNQPQIKLLDLLVRRKVQFSDWAKSQLDWQSVLSFCQELNVEAPPRELWEEFHPAKVIKIIETVEETESNVAIEDEKPTKRVKKLKE